MPAAEAPAAAPAPTPTRAPLFAAVAFLLAAGVGAAFVRLDETSRRELNRRAVSELGQARAGELERQLDRIFAGAYALGVAAGRGPGAAEFTAAAEDVLSRFPIVAVLGQAQGGVVTRLHPAQALGAQGVGAEVLEESERMLRLADPGRGGRFVVVGPVSRGRLGLWTFGLLPLGDGTGATPGMALAGVRVADLVAASRLPHLSEGGYDYRLSRTDATSARSVTFARSSELELADPVQLQIRVPGGDWTLSIAPRGGWRGSASLNRSIALVLVMSVLAALLAYDVLSKPELLRREVELRTRRLVEAHRQVMKEALQRERAEARLLHEASHDALTGLPNRVHFLSRLARAVEAAKQGSTASFALVQLGLDRFKNLNDSLGPAAGDRILLAAARRLESSLRPDDVAARVGGDEFAVLLADVQGEPGVLTVVERLQAALARPLMLDGSEVFSAASMGVVLGFEDYTVAEDLLRDADLAMHRAKAQGGARHVRFERAMHDRALTAQALEGALRRGIERDELCVFYQPVVLLGSGRVSGFEALVRWRNPERGFVSPGEFIPLAEATGLVTPIDRRVWAEAAGYLRRLHARFPRDPALSVSVNLSTRHLLEPDLLDEVSRVLERSGLEPRSLRIEITESAMMDDTERAAGILAQLKTLDVQLLLDDFGTGYSSMSYLQELPIDVLKVDRSFVSRLGMDEKHRQIVATIINLAHGLGMRVVAEGIETAEQLALLRELGCDYGQGYLFAKPLPPDALEALLAADRRF